MTVLVADINDTQIWMAADTAIPGLQIPSRERVYQPKIAEALARVYARS